MMNTQEYKKITQNAYDKDADYFESRFAESFARHGTAKLDRFMSLLPGKRILDIGCGSGVHAQYFSSKGFDVQCIDSSKAMVEITRKKGLPVQRMDAEKMTFPKGSFDGIWCHNSLLHLKKNRLPSVLAKICDLLAPNGLFGLILKEGQGERFDIHETGEPPLRWFAYYSKQEIQDVVPAQLQAVEFYSFKPRNTTFLWFLYQKK